MAYTRETKFSSSYLVEEKSSSTTTTTSPMFGAVKDTCGRCNQLIYPTELMGQIMGLKYHRNCFRCFVCDRTLDLKTYMTNTIDLSDKQIYCPSHAPKSNKHNVPFIGGTGGRSRSPAVNVNNVTVNSNTNSPKTTHVPMTAYWRDRSRDRSRDSIDSLSSRNKISVNISPNLANQQSTYLNKSQSSLNDLDHTTKSFDLSISSPSSSSSSKLLTDQHNISNLSKSSTQESLNKNILTKDSNFKASEQLDSKNKFTRQESIDSSKFLRQEESSSFNHSKNYISQSSIDFTIGNKSHIGFPVINTYNDDFSEKSIKERTKSDDLSTNIFIPTIKEFHISDKEFHTNTSIEKNTKEIHFIEKNTILDPVYLPIYPNVDVPIQINGASGSTENLKTIMSEVLIKSATANDTTPTMPTINADKNKLVKKGEEEDFGSTYNLKTIVFEVLSNSKLRPNADLLTPIVRPVTVTVLKPSEPPIFGEDKKYGCIKLSIHYDELRSRLSITVHEAQALKNVEKKGLSDPYARIYLLPDDKQNSYKRKTKVVKDNLNPKWEETFDYTMTHTEAVSKDLIVNLKDEKGFFERQDTQFLGEVVLKMRQLDIKKPMTKWFYLQPLNTTSKMLLNSGIRPYS